MDEDLRLAAIEASKLFKKGKYDDAVDICTLGISDYPQYSSLYLILAKSYLALGNVTEAHKVFESASKFFVNDPLINTLKEILEATPSINSEPTKKKTQQTNELPTIDDEITPDEIESQLIEEGTLISEELFEPEITIDEEDANKDIKEEVVSDLEEEYSEDIQLHDLIEEFDGQTSTLQDETDIENVISIEDLPEEITNDIEVELPNQDNIENSNVEVHEVHIAEVSSEFEEVLNGFDQIVSNLETEELYEEEHEELYEEVQNDDFEEDESEFINSVSDEKDESLLFEIPSAQSSANNFIRKIRESVTPIESLQFSVEKQQFLSVLPSLNELSKSSNKVHHLDDFHISLDNPLQDLDIVSTIANEPMVFEDSYKGKSSKYEDVVVFEHSIISLDSIDSNVPLLGKKA